MFFYNVNMLPADLFEQSISFRVSKINVNVLGLSKREFVFLVCVSSYSGV